MLRTAGTPSTEICPSIGHKNILLRPVWNRLSMVAGSRRFFCGIKGRVTQLTKCSQTSTISFQCAGDAPIWSFDCVTIQRTSICVTFFTHFYLQRKQGTPFLSRILLKFPHFVVPVQFKILVFFQNFEKKKRLLFSFRFPTVSRDTRPGRWVCLSVAKQESVT